MAKKNNELIEYARKEYKKLYGNEMKEYTIDKDGVLSAPASKNRIFISNAVSDKKIKIQGFEWRECRIRKLPELRNAIYRIGERAKALNQDMSDLVRELDMFDEMLARSERETRRR